MSGEIAHLLEDRLKETSRCRLVRLAPALVVQREQLQLSYPQEVGQWVGVAVQRVPRLPGKTCQVGQRGAASNELVPTQEQGLADSLNVLVHARNDRGVLAARQIRS